MGKFINEIGNTYHYLEVFARGRKKPQQKWWCYCHNDGNFCEVFGHNLRSGRSNSCGCYQRERTSKVNKGKQSHLGCKHTQETKDRQSQLMKGRYKGDKHPNWNPKLTNEEREDRRNKPEYKNWVQVVFERDNWTCQCCGDDTGGNLVAHHLFSWNKYTGLRYVVCNGITWCDECHIKFHKQFGYGDNTPFQVYFFTTNKEGDLQWQFGSI